MARGYRYGLGLRIGEKAAPYVAPWAITAVAMPVAVLLHFTIGSDGLWMAVLGCVFTSMTYGTWRTWKNRRPETRTTATIFVGALLGWVAMAGARVPWSGDMLKAYVVGGVSLSSFWMIRHTGTTGGHERDKSGDTDGSWLGRKISAFKNSKTADVRDNGSELRWREHLEAPTTAGDAQRAVDQVAAVAGVGKDQVKVVKVPGDEGQVDVVLTRAADMSRPLKYRGPSAPGQSISAAPLWLGRRTDGSDIEWWISGSSDPDNPRPVAHTKCTGVTGSGKTETVCTAILDMRWRTDVVPVVADPAKFQQSFGDIEECLGLAARNKEETEQLVANLPEAVKYRAELLGSLERADGGRGYKQWEPECFTRHGVPFIFVDIEEAADVVMNMDVELDEAVRKLRSVGIHLCISMQTMPHDNIPRKTRGQFSQSLAHGQNEYQDAKYALSEGTLNANADPTKWKNNHPGSLYAEVTGTDESHWAIDGRAVYMTLAEKQMCIAGSRQFWATVDEGTYARLAYGIDPAVTPEDEAEQEEYEEMDGSAMFSGVPGADPTVPMTPPPAAALDIHFSDGPPQPVNLTVEQARERLMDRLRVLWQSNQKLIKFADLADLPEEVGRSRGWVYENLKLLVEAGVLKEFRPPEGGVVYQILRPFPQAG